MAALTIAEETDLLLQALPDVVVLRARNGDPHVHLDRRTHPIDSSALDDAITRRSRRDLGHVPRPAAIKAVLRAWRADALDAPMHDVYVRIGEHAGKLYVDLADDRGRVVEIDGDGRRVLDTSPVYFVRYNGMLALPEPTYGGSLDPLWDHVHVVDSDDRIRVITWLVSSFRARGPYMPLALLGDAGAAKTAALCALRRMIDPHDVPHTDRVRSGRDLVITASKSWVYGLDNQRTLTHDESDNLARLATGAGFHTRTLFTNNDATYAKVCRPMILTAIGDVITQSDLLDRSIRVHLDRVTDFRTEATLRADWQRDHAGMLGAVLDLVSKAIRDLPTVNVTELRMADAVNFAVAALGEDVVRVLRASKVDDHAVALESSVLTTAIRSLVATRAWSGSATDLLTRLNAEPHKATGWPTTPNQLGLQLRRLKPALASVGIAVEIGHGGRGGRYVRLRRDHDDHDDHDVTARPANGDGVADRAAKAEAKTRAKAERDARRAARAEAKAQHPPNRPVVLRLREGDSAGA